MKKFCVDYTVNGSSRQFYCFAESEMEAIDKAQNSISEFWYSIRKCYEIPLSENDLFFIKFMK